ncbi:c-type cytochrome [Rheinheimera sp.]|jgi:cytochrome c oxidase subunit 2|uniref:c-type cytochrome n=1 Tax=Rheinheimera sp. TaxID=1869214 RepID=UPI00261FEA92|nr:c-type cytochrome [Rheinheimera sp.]MCA1930634.1 c-type cytochrome [Rheinheimera sp.]
MTWKLTLLLTSILLLYSSSLAAELTDKAASCNACHAAENQQATKAPALAGQQQPYLKKQLLQFQSGERGSSAEDSTGQVMAAVAKQLTAAEVEALSRYFSALAADRPKVELKAEQQEPALLDKGRRVYIGSCGACHGNKAQGNLELKAPALTILSQDYLLLQLQHFQTGVRGSNSADKPGRQMAMMSRTLSEADKQAVVAYLMTGL